MARNSTLTQAPGSLRRLLPDFILELQSPRLLIPAETRPIPPTPLHSMTTANDPDHGAARRHLAFLSRTWKRATALLCDAEEAEIRDPSLGLWLRDLRSVSYDAEDILDLYRYELLRVEATGGVSPINPAFWHDVEPRVRALLRRFDLILERRRGEVSDCDDEGDEDWLFDVAPRKPTRPLPPVEDRFVGRGEEMEDVVQMLLSDDSPRGRNEIDVPVIAVVGMGGVGKTTLVQQVYNDPRVQEHFNKLGWVHVSTDFDIVRLTKEALEGLTGYSSPLSELAPLQEAVNEEVEGKRILLVLDDVWNEIAAFWDNFKGSFRDVTRGSKFLITTRHQQVVNTIRVVRPYQLHCLSEDEAWSLFKLHAFGNSDPVEWPVFKIRTGWDIAKRCNGLPLAVKVLGGMLRHEDGKERWKAVLESDLCEIKGEDGEILGPLRLSYLYMPAQLKPCFTFCALFSRHYEIKKEELVRLWMAHGLIQDKYRINLEDIGMDYIEDLLSRSFFHSMSDAFGEVNRSVVVMHDLIYDLAQGVSGEEFQVTRAEKLLNLSPNVRHASFCNATIRIEGASMLRTLLTTEEGLSSQAFVENQKFDHLKSLRVLDFCPYTKNLPSSIDNLKLLRYLKLGYSEIERLPESICTFYQLQTLDLENAYLLKELPECVGSLRHLRYIDIQGTQISRLPESVWMLFNLGSLNLSSTSIEELPNSVGQLKSLCHFRLSGTKIKKLPEMIGRLYNVQELRLNEANVEELPTSIGNLKLLRHLDLRVTKIKKLPESLRKLCNLRELDLRETCIEEMPDLFGSMKQLWRLDLRESRIKRLPQSIGMLFNLKALELSDTQIEALPDSVGTLKNLHICDLQRTKIKKLPESICLLYNLKTLDVRDCRELAELPQGMGNLINLEDVYINFCNLSYLPRGIGSLTKLTSLARFPVGCRIEHAGILELKNLINLKGSLVITGLHNVESIKDARIANLTSKLFLRKLELNWRGKSPPSAKVNEEEKQNVAKREEEVLEELQPPAPLKVLHSYGYGGIQLPPWVRHVPFAGLHTLKLRGFAWCRILLPDWKMPSLHYLSIEDMPSLERLDDEFARAGRFSEFLMLYILSCPLLSSIKVPVCDTLKVYRCKNLISIHFQQSEVRELLISGSPQLYFLPQASDPVKRKEIKLSQVGEPTDSHRGVSCTQVGFPVPQSKNYQ